MTITPLDQPADQPLAGVEPGWVVTVRETARLARYIADTDFVPRAFRGNPAAVTAAMLYGDELGVGRITALQTISPIQGKVGMSAELMRSLVLSAGHRIELVTLSTDRCTIRGQRAGSDTWQEVTWTLDDAKRADLRGDGWRKYPRAMLMARATTELCRFMFADVLHGIVAVEEYADTPATPEGPTSTAPPPAPESTPSTPPRVIQRGKAADSTPGGSPPPSMSTPASAEGVGPDTRNSAPGESVPTPHSAGAGGRTPPPETGSLGRDEGQGSSAHPAPETDDLFSEPPEAEPPEDAPAPEGEWLMNKYARREYHALMRSLGVDDRDERLFITRVLSDRDDLASSSDLTEAEGTAVLAVLRRCKTRGDLEAIVAAAHDAVT